MSLFLNTYKAFDTVSHTRLFNKLVKHGIQGKFLKVIVEAYTDVSSAVIINSQKSRWFTLKRGLRQGGTLSTLLYLVHINDLLNELQNSNIGAKILNVNAGNPALADDIALIATSPRALQQLIDIAANYSKQQRFRFNSKK